jgi:cell division protein FtsB
MAIRKETSATFWWLIFILAAIIMTALLIYPLHQNKNRKMRELEERKKVLVQKENEAKSLNQQVDQLRNSPEAVEREARDKFRMAKPDEEVITYEQNREK